MQQKREEEYFKQKREEELMQQKREEEYLQEGDEFMDTQSAIVLEELIGQFLLNQI